MILSKPARRPKNSAFGPAIAPSAAGSDLNPSWLSFPFVVSTRMPLCDIEAV